MLSVNMRSASELTKAVNLLPVKPTYFGGIGLFEEKGSRTTSVTLDVRHGRFVLVPNRDRRDPATPLAGRGSKWKTQTFPTAHLPLSDVLLPDDVHVDHYALPMLPVYPSLHLILLPSSLLFRSVRFQSKMLPCFSIVLFCDQLFFLIYDST